MLVTMKEILERASAENYGVAAPNVNTELDARCALEAAEEATPPSSWMWAARPTRTSYSTAAS